MAGHASHTIYVDKLPKANRYEEMGNWRPLYKVRIIESSTTILTS